MPHARRLLFAMFVVTLLGTPAGAITLNPGDILITEFYDDWHLIDPVTGASWDLELPATDSVSVSAHLAFDDDGNILFAATASDSINRLDLTSGLITGLPLSNVQLLTGFVVETGGSLLIAESDSVDRFDPTGPNTGEIATRDFFDPNGIAIGADGRVFVTEFFEQLWEVDPETGGLSLVTSVDVRSPDLIAVRAGGDLIVRENFDNRLLSINPDTGSVTTFSEDLPTFPKAIAVDADGDVLMTSTDGVFRFDGSTGVRTTLTDGSTGTFFSPQGIAVVPQTFEAPTTGDFNHDGVVNAADYVVWRNNASGRFTQDDYNSWRENFGSGLGTGSATGGSVPEPSGWILAGWMALASLPLRCRRY